VTHDVSIICIELIQTLDNLSELLENGIRKVHLSSVFSVELASNNTAGGMVC
jgi:hypothetical protein